MVLRDEVCLATEPDTVIPGEISGIIRDGRRIRQDGVWLIAGWWILRRQNVAAQRGGQAGQEWGDAPKAQLF
jgi:hypothetical protein